MIPGYPSHPGEKRVATSLTQAYSSSSLSTTPGLPKAPTNGSGVHPFTAAMQPGHTRVQTMPSNMTSSQVTINTYWQYS